MENDTHHAFLEKRRQLERVKVRRIRAAEKFRNLQYRNFDQLYDFEIINCEAQYDVEVQQLRDEMAEDIGRQISAVRESLRSFCEDADAGDIAPMTLRRKPPKAKVLPSRKAAEGRGREAADSGEAGKTPHEALALSSAAAAATAPRAGSVFLQPTLGEADIRSDLAGIVQDLRTAASRYDGIGSDGLEVQAPGPGVLVAGPITVLVGDLVQATSSLSGEDFLGTVAAVSALEQCLYLKLLGGGEVRVRFRHVATGQVRLTKRGSALGEQDLAFQQVLSQAEGNGTLEKAPADADADMDVDAGADADAAGEAAEGPADAAGKGAEGKAPTKEEEDEEEDRSQEEETPPGRRSRRGASRKDRR